MNFTQWNYLQGILPNKRLYALPGNLTQLMAIPYPGMVHAIPPYGIYPGMVWYIPPWVFFSFVHVFIKTRYPHGVYMDVQEYYAKTIVQL